MLDTYKINMNILSDDNECTNDDHSCEHNCHNTDGSYICSCNTGYSLSSNGFSCNGKQL